MSNDAIGVAGDRRRARRYQRSYVVWYQRIDTDIGGPGGFATGTDISRLGLSLATTEPLPARARLLLHVRCRECEFTTVGTVAWAAEAGNVYRAGVELQIVPPTQRVILDSIFP